MKYAVVQSEITKPEPDALATAFRALPELVDVDAATLSSDAYGIIADEFDLEHATRLSAALKAEGISTEVVPYADLPELTPAKHVQRLDCTAEHMLLYDTVGHTTAVPWSEVVLVAAGLVTAPEFTRIEHTRTVMRGAAPRGGAYPILLADISSHEETRSRLALEIYMSTAPVRIGINAHEFQYNYLAERMKGRYMENYVLLVQDVGTLAGSAILNRGAESLRDDSTVTFHYPTRHAFEEEVVWLLWSRMQAQCNEGEQ